MEGVGVEKLPQNPNGGIVFGSFATSSLPCRSHHSLAMNGISAGHFGSRTPPPPPYSYSSSIGLIPLIPSPNAAGAGRSPAKRMAVAAAASPTRSNRQRRPKTVLEEGKAQVAVPHETTRALQVIPGWGEAEEEEEGSSSIDSIETVYSKSPPPSSLPLPRFCLTRAKAAALNTSCLVDDRGCTGGGVDAGATDGLRRLLRL